jgi:hypothetical protein
MAKKVDNTVLDAALADIATCTRLTLCSAEPANFAGIAAVLLGSYTLTAGSGSGDYLISDGDVSGRKLRVLAQTGNNASATGTGNHVCLDNGSILKYATTCPNKAVTISEPFDVSLWDIELADPA